MENKNDQIKHEDLSDGGGHEQAQNIAKNEKIKTKIRYGQSGGHNEVDEYLYITDKRFIFSGSELHRTDILIKDVESFTCEAKKISRLQCLIVSMIFLYYLLCSY